MDVVDEAVPDVCLEPNDMRLEPDDRQLMMATNGSRLSERIAQGLVVARVARINLSLDGGTLENCLPRSRSACVW